MRRREPIITNRKAIGFASSLSLLLISLIFCGSSLAAGEYDEALLKYRQGKYSEAADILSSRTPKSAGEYNLLGWALLNSKRPREAIAQFELSLAAEPLLYDSYCGLGYSHFRLGQFEKALGYFNEGLSKNRTNVECLLGLGLTFEQLHDAPKAESIFQEVLSIDSNNQLAQDKLRILPPYRSEDLKKEITEFYSKGDYFWIRPARGKFNPLFIKGVNMSFAVPGKFPSEFPEDENIYFEWFALVGEMHANVIRVYTILPPQFYKAFKRYNEGRDDVEKLYLIQGIWAELPETSDFREEKYLGETRTEIRNAIDVIHGNARIAQRYGHAHGIYRSDVSENVLGFIFGREWEPPNVIQYNKLGNPDSFTGKYLKIAGASPMEVWLAEMLDYLICYESDKYSAQRPVSFMNWPPLDPIYHQTEATFKEQVAFRQKTGEIFGDIDYSKTFDEDAVSLDEMRIVATGKYRAGIFASYHAYPYYPDFLLYEKKYGKTSPVAGSDHYYNYLLELKNHYKDIPLLISEFGVPTSRGIARFQPEGFGHGGHSEDEQADILSKMIFSLKESGCAGGIVFSWLDEWSKKSWMVRGTEERDHLWYNAQDPEENYGLLAMTPEKKQRLSGNPSVWDGGTLLYRKDKPEPLRILKDGYDGARNLGRIFADYDQGYFYLRIDISGQLDWEKNAYLIAIDTFGTEEGNHRLPFNINVESPVGFEYVILLHGENSKILIQDKYNRIIFDKSLLRFPGLSGYRENMNFHLSAENSGNFSELLTIHPRKFSRDGEVFPEKIYNASILRQGKAPEDSLSDFYYSRENNFIEIRLPWALLNFSDPSRSQIIYSGKESKITDGIRIMAISYKPRDANDSRAEDLGNISNIADMIPENLTDMKTFRWNGWETADYLQRPKKAYYRLKELFASIKNPEMNINLPRGFDFVSVIKAHYDSPAKFDQMFLSSISNPPGNDTYGLALANMIYGLVKNEPYYILKAKSLFGVSASTLKDQRKKELALSGVQYAENILTGRFPDPAHKGEEPEPVQITKAPLPKKNIKKITIGKSCIRIDKNTRIKTQVDRVTRDWLMVHNVAADPWNIREENIAPWHEGEKIREIVQLSGAKVSSVWGTRARKFGDSWYSPDEKGVYRFVLSEDKVYNYPSNIIIDGNTVIINDTHGISALAWDSSDVDLVIGCGDFRGKIESAHHLASKGIHVYMPTDRFLAKLIGTQTSGVIIGSAPVKKSEHGAVIGDQPITFDVDETIVVSTATGGYPLQYYDTPYNYFKELEGYVNRAMDIVPVPVTVYGKSSVVVEEARRRSAKLIGIRVWGKEEHDAVASWLREDKNNRAVLFHSAVYPEGYRLFFEFPEQTSFGDINIYFES